MQLALIDPMAETAAAFAHRYTTQLTSSSLSYRSAGRETGTYCLRGNYGSGAINRWYYDFTGDQYVIVKFGFRASDPQQAEAVIVLRSSGGTEMLAVEGYKSGRGDGSYFFKVRVGSIVLYNTQVYEPDQWFCFEMKVKLSTSEVGNFTWRVNETVEAARSSVVTSASGSTAGRISFGLRGDSTGDYAELQDVVVLTGSDADFPGDVEVSVHYPTADSSVPDEAGWTGGFADVDDEAGGDYDGDTTYASAPTGSLGLGLNFSSLERERGAHVAVARLYVDARMTGGTTSSLLFAILYDDRGDPVGFSGGGALPTISTSYAVLALDAFTDPRYRPWTLDVLRGMTVALNNATGQTVRVTRVWLETMAPRRPTVEAGDLPDTDPTFVLPDWSAPPMLESSWSTAVSQAKEADTEDRVALLTRPSRRVETRTLGIAKAAASAVVLSQERRSMGSSLALLTPDVARLTQSYTSGTSLYCDTTARRFHVGARITVVLPDLDQPAAATRETRLVSEVYHDHLVLESSLDEDYPEMSRVYPVIDAEVAVEADLEAITDEIVALRFDAQEAQGPGALPASWRGDSIGLWPTGPDGIPIFNPAVTWSKTPTMSVRRRVERGQLGKGYVLDVDGSAPERAFRVDADAVSRAEYGRIAAFWDWARGRERSFWFVQPADSFDVQDIGSDRIDITPVGSLDDFAAMTKFVGFEDPQSLGGRIPGDPLILEVQSVVVFGDLWRITFTTTEVPASICRRTAPAWLARFTSDGLQEQWATDEVVMLEFSLGELIDESDAGISNPLLPASYPDPIGTAVLRSAMVCWFDSAQNCYDQDSLHGNVYVRSQAWPDLHSTVKRWVDCREFVPTALDEADMSRNRLHDGTSSEPRPFVTRFARQWLNRGRRAILNGPWYYYPMIAADEVSSESEKVLWDNTAGMTLFVTLTGGTRTFSSAKEGIWYAINSSGIQSIFKWTFWSSSTQGKVEWFSPPGTLVATLTHDDFEDGQTRCWVLRWLPGGAAQIFRDGGPTHIAAIDPSPSSLPSGIAAYAGVAWFQHFDVARPPGSSAADKAYGQHPILHSFLAYRRQLSHAEINQVGNYLATTHDVDWTDLP